MAATHESPPRVLVVDDDELSGHLYRDVLEGHGYRVDVVQTGADAMQYLTRTPCPARALILDYFLPDMTGGDVLDRIRPHCPDLPVLLISAHDVIMHVARDMRVTAWIVKPIAPPVLLAALAQCLGNSPPHDRP